MSKLSKNILQKIKKEAITPKPRWHFILKNIGIWLGILILMVLGIHATMLIFYFMMNLEILDLVLEMPEILPRIFLLGLPMSWIGLMIGLAFFAGYSMQKTKRGYKYSFAHILVAVAFIQLGIGGVLAQTPFAQKIEKKLRETVGSESLDQRKMRIWNIPEYGLLGGKIIEMEADQWKIENREKELWLVLIEEETAIPQRVQFQMGDRVKVKGGILNRAEKVFQAKEVFPMRGRRKEFEKLLRSKFQYLSPAERVKVREKIRKNRHPHTHKFLKSVPEEIGLEFLETLKDKKPKARGAFSSITRKPRSRGEGNKNIENLEEINDN